MTVAILLACNPLEAINVLLLKTTGFCQKQYMKLSITVPIKSNSKKLHASKPFHACCYQNVPHTETNLQLSHVDLFKCA